MGRHSKTPVKRKPVSIVMPTMDNLEYTKRAIDSIEKNTVGEYELLIVDNASSSDTLDYFYKKCQSNSKIKTILNESNKGVSKSWNIGILNAKYDIVCIVNNDIEVMTPDWLYRMQETLERSPVVYWVSPRTCYSTNVKEMSYKRTHYEQLAYGTDPNTYIVGCCFMCPKKIFSDEEIGLFDEKFDIKYYEDLDYINRIHRAGKMTCMCPSVIVYHAVGMTSRKTPGGETNESYYKEKWGGTSYDILAKNFNSRK